jgi:hypothetical protein
MHRALMATACVPRGSAQAENMEYLKNVIVKYMETDEHEVRTALRCAAQCCDVMCCVGAHDEAHVPVRRACSRLSPPFCSSAPRRLRA